MSAVVLDRPAHVWRAIRDCRRMGLGTLSLQHRFCGGASLEHSARRAAAFAGTSNDHLDRAELEPSALGGVGRSLGCRRADQSSDALLPSRRGILARRPTSTAGLPGGVVL